MRAEGEVSDHKKDFESALALIITYLPAGHSVHWLRLPPACSLYFPMGHAVHEFVSCAVASDHLPFAHGVHAALPVPDCHPRGHEAQSAASSCKVAFPPPAR